MRVRRGSLESEKEPDGRVYVWLNGDESETKPGLDGEPSALISAKDETIRVLSEQLESEREARRRADTIIAQLTQANAALAQRVPELQAPQTHELAARGATKGAAGEQEEDGTGDPRGAVRPRDTAEFPVHGSLARPWWRRAFGG